MEKNVTDVAIARVIGLKKTIWAEATHSCGFTE